MESKIIKKDNGRVIQKITVEFEHSLGKEGSFMVPEITELEFYEAISFSLQNTWALGMILSMKIGHHTNCGCNVCMKIMEMTVNCDSLFYKGKYTKSDISELFNTDELEGLEEFIHSLNKGVMVEGYVYLMKNMRNGYVKIGFSKNPKFRERTLQSEEPEIELLWKREGTYSDEKTLHEKYAELRLRGEWFALEDSHIQEIINKG